jgi:hypothetical protein
MDYTLPILRFRLENLSYKFLGSRQAHAYEVLSSANIIKLLAYLYIPHISTLSTKFGHRITATVINI